MTEDFIQKLMISKKIMEKHNEIPRGQVPSSINETTIPTQVELYSPEPISAKYNIPEEFISQPSPKPVLTAENTQERIMKSKLPDAIKELMISHPIKKPETYNPTISSDILEKAARLMNENKEIPQKKVSKPTQTMNGDIVKIIKETLEELLMEYGVISESESSTQETFQFRVGKHIFEGRVTKIKKLK
jgi:hypothetical protein